jgi:outer membrane immunogenic protein
MSMKLRFLVLGAAMAGAAILLPALPANADGMPRGGARDYAPFSWTGFYAGLNAGYGWAHNSADITGDGSAGNYIVNGIFTGTDSGANSTHSQSLRARGIVGGLQAGYNWQFARSWVAGLETDIQFFSDDGQASTTGAVGFFAVPHTLTSEQDLQWFGTLRGRLGFLAGERLLVFGTGGLAYGHSEVSAATVASSGHSISVGGGTNWSCAANQVCLAGSDSKTLTGWTAGGGFEWAWIAGASLKVEYLHVDLGDQSIVLVPQAPGGSGNASIKAKFDNTMEIVRAGINVRF